MSMSGTQLKALAVEAFGARGWQLSLARLCHVDASTIRRWANKEKLSPRQEASIRFAIATMQD